MLLGLQGTLAAASVGLGCGTCCGSGISAFLFGYLTTHAKGMKQSALAFLSFYMGKIFAVMTICIGSSLLGRQIIEEGGSIFRVDVQFIINLAVLFAGIWLTIQWIYERTRKSCRSCSHCGSRQGHSHSHSADTVQKTFDNKSPNPLLLLGMGISYGASPCAPLIFVAGLAASMTAASAAFSGAVFAISSALVPAVMILLLSGVLAGKLRKEIPQYIEWFRLLAYLALIGVAIYGFV